MNAKVENEARNKAVVKRYWEGKFNQRRPEILDELQTQDVQYHSPSMQMNGIEEYKQAYNMYLSAFHDTQVTIEELIAEGDKVMSRVSLNCTHKGEFEGLPPTGKALALRAFTVFRLVDGKIAEELELVDELGMMHQLGMELRPTEQQSKTHLAGAGGEEAEALMDLSRQWSATIASGDLEGGMDFWANDAVMLPPDLPLLDGKEAIREYVEAAAGIPGFKISWEPVSAHVSKSGELAYMLERNVTEVDGPGGNKVITHGKVVTVWRKDATGKWRNVVDMWNATPLPGE
jgi:steroid delta-isomerase-like uncharacterized protein